MTKFAGHLHAGSTVGATRDLRTMYEQFPYPPPDYDGYQLTVPWILEHLELDLAGRSVLDFGCGTGKKLAALAEAFPDTRFTGIDMSAASLAAARERVADRPAGQVTLLHGDLWELDVAGPFDVITSLGVVHHLSDPAAGLRKLRGLLADDGLVVLTLYHSLGTFPTLLSREVLLTLLGDRRTDLTESVALLDDFLAGRQGSGEAAAPRADTSKFAGEVDALINPIVNAYRFEDCLDLVRAAGFDWGAVDFALAGTPLSRAVLDLGGAGSAGALTPADLFPGSPLCQERFAALPPRDRLRVAELVLTPFITGLLAGPTPALPHQHPRLRSNAIPL